MVSHIKNGGNNKINNEDKTPKKNESNIKFIHIMEVWNPFF